jgi:hypothetical protein
MRFNLRQIFPMPDAPSARLMKLKAMCLSRAGVLSEDERAAVMRKADAILASSRFRHLRRSYGSKAA